MANADWCKIENTYEYKLIQEFYGDHCAERSGVPLMQHIDEGLAILDTIGASDSAKRGYCLHPLIQDYEIYKLNIKRLRTDPKLSAVTLHRAKEYREYANSYLCKPETDSWTLETMAKRIGYIPTDVYHMLIADKRQNFKDFMRYHFGTHERSLELTRYFNNWLEYLGVLGAPLNHEKN